MSAAAEARNSRYPKGLTTSRSGTPVKSRGFLVASWFPDVVLHPGELVPVFYAVPSHQFTGGAIGHEKQARPGQGAMVARFATMALGFAALVMALAILRPSDGTASGAGAAAHDA